jgi:hypothetical protein
MKESNKLSRLHVESKRQKLACAELAMEWKINQRIPETVDETYDANFKKYEQELPYHAARRTAEPFFNH